MCQCKLWLSVFVACLCVLSVTTFNVDSFNYASYDGPESSMFGFSMALHKEGRHGWLIVGAPEAQSYYQRGVYHGGVVYKCPTDRDGSCEEIPFDTKGHNFDKSGQQMDNKTEQWFGATVSSSGKAEGPIVACAPRYTWYPMKKSRRDPVGTCYVSNGLLNNFNEYSPCRTYQWGFHRQGSCQAGFSAAINTVGDRLFVGSPGSWYWQGQMYSIDAHATFDFKPLLFSATYGHKGQVHQQSLEMRPAVFSTTEGAEKDDNSYLGYSTITGDFLGNGEDGIAVGMPRGNNLRGKVLLFTWNLTNFLGHFTSDQLGSYYGYALAASDVDGDNKTDLIIGSPMYTVQNNEDKYDVGRVYVIYHHSDKGKFVATYKIDGFNSKSRFGQALASLGDINQDGCGDFAVGAPYDGVNNRGAVYIYHGSKTGVRKKYSQVIFAEDVIPIATGALTTFGFSVTGGLDLDGNEYPDMAVGAYLSNKAFFFRSRPVVRVDASVEFLTQHKEIDIAKSDHVLRGFNNTKAVKTAIRFCSRYYGKGIPESLTLDLQYILDSKKLIVPRMGFVDNEGQNIKNDTITLDRNVEKKCEEPIEVYVRCDIRDKLTPLVAEVKYWMKDDPDLGSSYSHQLQRNPQSYLTPVLDLNSPPSKKDSISVHKNCGSDNICIPNLGLKIKHVEKYLLDSDENLVLEVWVSNDAEDSFETTLEVKYPDNLYYGNSADVKVETHVLCSVHENNTVKCEIGNPVPGGKVVHFKLWWRPNYDKEMTATYDFLVSVNSTNQELAHTLDDNIKKVSVKIFTDSHQVIVGKSYPAEIFLNSSLYTEDISNQTRNTNATDSFFESVIGPQVTHVYHLKNEGKTNITETELFFAWPAYTLSGEDFLYLLDAPHFSITKDLNIRCGPVPANYRGFLIEGSKKSIWERLNIDIESEEISQTSTSGEASAQVGSTVGGGIVKNVEPIDKAVETSGDSSHVYKARHNVTHHEEYNISTSKNTSFSSINGGMINETHYRNASGVFAIGGGEVLSQSERIIQVLQGENLVSDRYQTQIPGTNYFYRCLRKIDGAEKEIDCGADFTFPVTNLTWILQRGEMEQMGNIRYQCIKNIGGKMRIVDCGNFRIPQVSNQGQINVQRTCHRVVNGVSYAINCDELGGNNDVIEECYQNVNGERRKIPCDEAYAWLNRTYKHQQSGGGFQLGQGVERRCYQSVNGAPHRETDCMHFVATSNTFEECFRTVNGERRKIPCEEAYVWLNGTYKPQWGGGGSSSSHQSGGSAQYGQGVQRRCYQLVNGAPRETDCMHFVATSSTFEECFRTINGERQKIPCEEAYAWMNGTYRYQQGGGSSSSSQQSGGSSSSSHQSGGSFHHGQDESMMNVQRQCYHMVNGAPVAMDCKHFVVNSNTFEECFRVVNGERQNVPCEDARAWLERQSGESSSFSQQWGSGSQHGQSVRRRCYQIINGVSREADCQHFGRNSNVFEECFQIVNGVRQNMPCEQARTWLNGTSRYQQIGGGSTSTHQMGGVSQHSQSEMQVRRRCHRIINGQPQEVDCKFLGVNKEVMEECFQTVKGVLERIPCEEARPWLNQQTGNRAQYGATGGSQYNQQSGASTYHQGGSQYNQHQQQGSGYDERQYGGSQYGINHNQLGGSQYDQHGSAYQGYGGSYGHQTQYDGEDEDIGKSITDYIQPNNYGSRERTYSGSHNEANGLGAAALGNGLNTVVLNVDDVGGNRLSVTSERHIERDNVPTDRPIKQRFYGRKKRQVLDNHPSIADMTKKFECKSVHCVYMRCTVENLQHGKTLMIALRGRLNARVLKNVSLAQPMSFSSAMAARIYKLPHIGTTTDQEFDASLELVTTVTRADAELKPDIVPLWVVVLSAVAGTIILLLLVFLLHKLGFFKRNRPSSAPERQPLNRNGYHHGDEAL